MRINSLFDEEASWFNSRVKCFPLYTLLLAVNHTNIDALSLGCQGQELQVRTITLYTMNLITPYSPQAPTIYKKQFSIKNSQILETIPFDKVNIQVITIHLDDFYGHMSNTVTSSSATDDYIQSVTRFLQSKSYKLVKKINHNYIYQTMIKHIKIINNQ